MTGQIFPQQQSQLEREINLRRNELSLEEIVAFVAQLPPVRQLTDQLIPLSNRPVTCLWSPHTAEGLLESPNGLIVEKSHSLDLEPLKRRFSIPLICDWAMIDEYQIWEARALGLDAVIFNPQELDVHSLQWMIEVCREAGMEPLCHVHDLETLRQTLATDVKILIINFKNLDPRIVMGQLGRWGRGRLPIAILEESFFLDVGNLNSLGYKSFYLKTNPLQAQTIKRELEEVFSKRSRHVRSALQKLWR